MSLKVDPEQERELKALAEATGRPIVEVLHELLGEAIAGRTRNGSLPAGGEETQFLKQPQAFEDLIAELDALPPEGLPEPKGRPVSSNVDEHLFGWKK
jgi:hypothetical protein